MGKRVTHRRKSKAPQIGDMRSRIVINRRAMGAPGAESAAFEEVLDPIDTVWSSVETLKGDKVFNDVAGNEVKPTTLFMIRFRTDVTFANIITFEGNNYKILPVDDVDKRNRFLYLYCALLGDEGLEANK